MRLSTLRVYRDNNTAVSLCMIFVCPASTCSAATGPESVSQLLEPAISGIQKRKRRCQLAATYLAARVTHRCTTPTCTMSLGTSRNRAIRRCNKAIHSKHFVTEKRSEKGVSCSHLPCAILQRYHTLLSVNGANVTSRSVDNYCQAWPSLSHTHLSIVN